MPPASFLDALKSAADAAAAAENAFRREVAERSKTLGRERAFAFRRLNLMRSLAEAVAHAEDPEVAVANGLAMLRAKLGWSSDSEARSLLYSPHRSAFHTQTAGRKFAFVDPGPSLAEPVIEAGFGLVAQYALRFGR